MNGTEKKIPKYRPFLPSIPKLSLYGHSHNVSYYPHSTEYCKNMSEIFPIVHYN